MFGLYYTMSGPKVLSGDKANAVLGTIMDGNIHFTDILAATGLSKSTLNFILNNLAEEKYIIVEGQVRSKCYKAVVLRVLFISDENSERRQLSGTDLDNLLENIEKHLLKVSIDSLYSAGATLWPALSEMAKFMGPAAYDNLTDWSYDEILGAMKKYFHASNMAEMEVRSSEGEFVLSYTVCPGHSPAMAELIKYFVKDFALTYISSMMGCRYKVSSFSENSEGCRLILNATDTENPYRSRLDFKLIKTDGVPELPAIVGVSTNIEVVSNPAMVRILKFLGLKKMTAMQISKELGIPSPTVFKYLSSMKSTGVIASNGRKYNETYWRELPDIFPWNPPEFQDYDLRELSMKAWEYPENFPEIAIDFIITYTAALGFDFSQFLSRTGKVVANALYDHRRDLSLAEVVDHMNLDTGMLEFRISSEDPLTIERESKRPLTVPVASGLRKFYNNFFANLIELYSGCRPSIRKSLIHGEGNKGHRIVFDTHEMRYS